MTDDVMSDSIGGDYIIIKTWKNRVIGGLDFKKGVSLRPRPFRTSLGTLQLKQKLSNFRLSNLKPSTSRFFPTALSNKTYPSILYACIHQDFNEVTLGLICGQMRSSDIP